MSLVIKLAIPFISIGFLFMGCASKPSPTDVDKVTENIISNSFHDKGMVSVETLKTDRTNLLCSAAAQNGGSMDNKLQSSIEAENFKSIKLPTNGRFIGDWRQGEKIAQSGVGKTWSDDPKLPNGGNCYNCHQLTKEEIAYGTLGPSLYQYGKIRGVRDPNSSDSKEMVLYTWGKLWNAKGFNACSIMPRFGHSGILTEEQIKDVMALLLDPKSPVNQ